MPADAQDSRVPVTVLTGFLGSGKTTLLNHILKDQSHGLRFAIIENEFGEVGVDEKLIGGKQDISEEVIEVMNGCICCTVRGDLVEALKRLYGKVKSFDAVLIETTGMADPAPVAQTFFVDEDVQQKYRLDGIVTVVDALHLVQHLDEEKPEGAENESVEQIAFADRIILNKCDLLEPEAAKKAVADEDCKDADSEAYTIGNNKINDDAEKPQEKKAKLEGASMSEKLAAVEKRIKSINGTAPILRSQFSKVDPKELLNIGSFDLDRVLEMDPEFLESDGTDHVHDDTITSIAWSSKGLELNVNKLNNWISELLQDMSNDLFRYKGVIAVKGKKEKFVFQGVHMLFSGGFLPEGGEWGPNEERECRFVFIGKNIKQEHEKRLKDGFMDCEAEKELRFKIGDFVQARVSGGWKKAQVLRTWDNGNPYRLELQNLNKTNVWGPIDSDIFVKAVDENAGA